MLFKGEGRRDWFGAALRARLVARWLAEAEPRRAAADPERTLETERGRGHRREREGGGGREGNRSERRTIRSALSLFISLSLLSFYMTFWRLTTTLQSVAKEECDAKGREREDGMLHAFLGNENET